jgi:hypothetical protein
VLVEDAKPWPVHSCLGASFVGMLNKTTQMMAANTGIIHNTVASSKPATKNGASADAEAPLGTT